MEIHKYICDSCGEELDEKKVTISQHYSDSSWNGLDETYHTKHIDKEYHLCPKCWNNIAKLVIKS